MSLRGTDPHLNPLLQGEAAAHIRGSNWKASQLPDFLHPRFVSHSVLDDRCSALSVERLHYTVSTTLTSILSLRERKPQQCSDSVESSNGPHPLFVSRGAKTAPTFQQNSFDFSAIHHHLTPT